MFGAIDIDLILDLARKEGMYEQLPLFETPPEFEIEEKHLTGVFSGWSCPVNERGNRSGVVSTIDHPAFTSLRNVLDGKGYIECQRAWINGDRVLKEFYVNGHLFVEGDQFSCAAAMKYTLTKGNNKGKVI